MDIHRLDVTLAGLLLALERSAYISGKLSRLGQHRNAMKVY
jgi:23S rRNA-/tRNA-specific pseudouridylate synthase